MTEYTVSFRFGLQAPSADELVDLLDRALSDEVQWYLGLDIEVLDVDEY